MDYKEFSEINSEYVIKVTTGTDVLGTPAAYFVINAIDNGQGIVTGSLYDEEYNLLADDRYYFYKGNINLPCTNLSPTQISKLNSLNTPEDTTNE